MTFKEFRMLNEADAFVPFTTGDNSIGTNAERFSGDEYKSDNLPKVTTDKRNLKLNMGILNHIAPKIQKYMERYILDNEDTMKNTIRYMKQLGLDSSTGSRNLAIAYLTLLNSALIDSDGNSTSLEHLEGGFKFISAIKTQLGEHSHPFYTALFVVTNIMLNNNKVDFDEKYVSYMMRHFITYLKDIKDFSKPDSNVLTSIKDFESNDGGDGGSDTVAMFRKVTNSYMQKILSMEKNGKFGIVDVVGAPESFYDVKHKDGISTDDEFSEFKNEMKDVINDNVSSGETSFMRGQATVPVFDKYAQQYVNSGDKRTVKRFVETVIKMSYGSTPTNTSKFLNSVIDKFGLDFARELDDMFSVATHTTYLTKDKLKTQEFGGKVRDGIIQRIDKMMGLEDYGEYKKFVDTFSAELSRKNTKLTDSEKKYLSDAIGKRLETQSPKFKGRGVVNGKEMTSNMFYSPLVGKIDTLTKFNESFSKLF